MPVKRPVDLEDVGSWPPALREVVPQARRTVASFQLARLDIDQQAQADVLLRLRPPANPHSGAYCELVERFEEVLADERLLCFHCTRLTDGEAARMREGGLSVLSAESIRRRIDAAILEQHLSPAEAQLILASQTVAAILSGR